MLLLSEKLKNKKVILASNSPRRHQLLTETGIEFSLAESFKVEEVYPESTPAYKVAEHIAGLKSRAYPKPLADNEILITADTVVVLDGKILGKPDGREGAIAMLSALSGKKHTVITGVVIRDNRKKTTFRTGTHVWFRELSKEEIIYYVDNYRPFDKAGAYGIQEWIGYVAIEKIAGSYYNVMGLPMQMLYVNLGKFVD